MTGSEVEILSSVKSNIVRRHWIQMRDVWLASVPIVLSVHIWSLLHVFDGLPAWINRLTTWELTGAIAYTQVFAMLESVLVLVAFLVVSFFLPKRWFADQLAPATTLIVLVATGWAIAAHNYDKVIRTWGVRDFLPWLILVVISLTLALVLVSRSEKVKNILSGFVERAVVLSALYLFIDSLSVIIVLIRNL